MSQPSPSLAPHTELLLRWRQTPSFLYAGTTRRPSFLYAGTTRRPATNTVEAPCPNMELSRRLCFTKAGSTRDQLPWCVTGAANTASRRPLPAHSSAECRYHQHVISEWREQTPRTNLATGQHHTLPWLPSPSSPRQWHCLEPPQANPRPGASSRIAAACEDLTLL
jgi:hypothetical protein